MNLFDNINFANVLDHIEIDGQRLALAPLMKSVLSKETGHLTEFREEGYLTFPLEGPSWFERITQFLIARGGRLAYRYLSHDDRSEDNNVYLWEDGFVDVIIAKNYLTLSGASHNEQLAHDIHAFFDGQWVKPEKRGQIYAIVRQHNQLSLSSIGNAGIELIEGNYTTSVMKDYKFAIKDLQSSSPSGRIVIMRGAPGSGKTFLVRAMLLKVPDAMFVLVSPAMVTDLAGPELLPLLMSHRNGSGPIILILEDADKCLVSRDKDNINSIQSLLNLGDGILGSLLDIRIVATTNAHELHMEEAIMRPGRLSKMLEVEALDFMTAREVFVRLLPDVSLPDELTKHFKGINVKLPSFKMSLAEVYALARKHGWSSEQRIVEDADEDNEDYED